MAQAISIPAPSVTVGNAVSLDLLRLGPLKLLAESGAPASGNATQSLAGANPAGQSSASGASQGSSFGTGRSVAIGQTLSARNGAQRRRARGRRRVVRDIRLGKTAGPASAPSTDVRPATAPPVSVEIALPGRSAGIALAFETIATVLRADVRLQAADRVYGNILQALSGIGGRTAGDAAKVTVDDAVRMAGRVLQASRAGGLIDLSGLDSTVAGRKGAAPANAGRALRLWVRSPSSTSSRVFSEFSPAVPMRCFPALLSTPLSRGLTSRDPLSISGAVRWRQRCCVFCRSASLRFRPFGVPYPPLRTQPVA